MRPQSYYVVALGEWGLLPRNDVRPSILITTTMRGSIANVWIIHFNDDTVMKASSEAVENEAMAPGDGDS
jgi:hypothetical protein